MRRTPRSLKIGMVDLRPLVGLCTTSLGYSGSYLCVYRSGTWIYPCSCPFRPGFMIKFYLRFIYDLLNQICVVDGHQVAFDSGTTPTL